MRTIIVDDEPAAIESIRELMRSLANDLVLVGTATNGLQAFQLILEEGPDVIFLDVDLPLMNGLEVLQKLPPQPREIVFTTGSSSYALVALKNDAADYLVKPIDPAEFLLAVQKVRKRLALKGGTPPLPSVPRVQFTTQHAIIYLEETDITYITGKGSYCEIHTLNREKMIVSKSIGQIEEKLSPSRFFRCHNSHIINLDFVNQFNSKEGNHVILKDGSTVEVSRRSKDLLLQRLGERSR